MDKVKAIKLLYLGYTFVRLSEGRRRKRSMGVRDIYKKRFDFGDGQNLIEEMRLRDSDQFFHYMRMNVERFDYLLQLVGNLLKKRDMYTTLTPTQRLAMTLRFLAAGDSQSTLSFAYRCSPSTVCVILSETTKVLITVLKPIYLKPPSTEEEWREIAAGFWEQWQFSHCIGAIDGKHVKIQAPYKSNSAFFNYKKSFSLILLGVCDADYNFTIVDIGAEGSTCDGAVFSRSELGMRLHENTLGIPQPTYLPSTKVEMPYFLVGDAAFPLKHYLMKPYGGKDIPFESQIYNYRISRARRVIENAFGILAARWRIFQRPFACSLKNADSIVESAICLHNFIRKTSDTVLRAQYCPPDFIDSELSDGTVVEGEWRRMLLNENGAMNVGPRLGARNAAVQVIQQRNTLRDFVNGPAALPFQNTIVQVRLGSGH